MSIQSGKGLSGLSVCVICSEVSTLKQFNYGTPSNKPMPALPVPTVPSGVDTLFSRDSSFQNGCDSAYCQNHNSETPSAHDMIILVSPTPPP